MFELPDLHMHQERLSAPGRILQANLVEVVPLERLDICVFRPLRIKAIHVSIQVA